MTAAADAAATDSAGRPPKWRVVGPGLVVAATGVGAADLVATLVAGAKFGYTLLWVAVLGAVIKVVLVEGAGRYSLATGRTIFEGWRSLGRWTTWYFAPYIVVWGLVYGATAMSSSALPLVALFPDLSLRWTAIVIGLVGLVLVWFGTYAAFEKVMAVLVGIMFVTVVGAAVLTTPNLGEIVLGLRPIFPDDSIINVLAIAGGVGGTITLAAYGYWLREKGWATPAFMRVMRLDNGVAYAVTGIFVVAMLVVGAELYYSAGIAAETGDQALVQLSDVLDDRYGEVFGKVFLVGFFASSFSSLIGVWSGVSLMFADYVGNLRDLPSGHPDTRTGGRYFRAYMLWLTFPPMLLLLLDEPVGLILAYGTLGALFMPFLAITLLVLLNKRRAGALPHSAVPDEWRNGWLSNGFMSLCAVLFLALAVNELRNVLEENLPFW
ncbi:Nramp family divalent metal transporter [Nocardioides sp. cx-173]|uniref:Nramp family divalent metal transporter n=1 Tax=Nocardioides sp. cx-173 TaxID=2898796 RepID=UPI001E34C4E2|nr:Nramp family divalent metal transporter [Nocardioides sp. cx-173]MCD4523431.1 Nramp family divalent metal transporter [Nocardioides sp. cx-173]UGB42230.1 Nramp family divalent metal transporter [Nocardioides sp. cx-173]